MAIGDTAAAAGLQVFPSSQDWRLGYQNDNQRGDDIGAHILSGGHDLSGPGMTGVLPVAKGGTGSVDASTARTALGIIAANIPSGSSSDVQTDLNYLGTQIASKPSAGSTWTGPVNANGNVVASGDTGCIGRLQGVGSRGWAVTSNYAVAYLNGDGYLGVSSSVRSSKQDISDWSMSIDTFKALKPQTFRYKAAVEDDPDAGYDVGMIADDFVDAGLSVFTFNDPRSGDLAGLHYEKLAVALWSVVQQQQTIIESLTARVTTLEGANNG